MEEDLDDFIIEDEFDMREWIGDMRELKQHMMNSKEKFVKEPVPLKKKYYHGD